MPERSARRRALDLLARREHSRLELERKLRRAGFAASEVNETLAQLVEEGLLSDERYAEAYIRSCTERGIGPLRIRHDLAARGVEASLVTRLVDPGEAAWAARGRSVRTARFGEELPREPREIARQRRFLAGRGFTWEQVRAALGDEEVWE